MIDTKTKKVLHVIHQKYGLDYDELLNTISVMLQPKDDNVHKQKVKSNTDEGTVRLEYININEISYLYDEATQDVYTYGSSPKLIGRYDYDLGLIIRDV